MKEENNFLKNLVTGRYKTAFDPTSKRYVSIIKVDISTDIPTIIARRISDCSHQTYKVYQLVNFS